MKNIVSQPATTHIITGKSTASSALAFTAWASARACGNMWSMPTPNIIADDTIAHVVGGTNSRYSSFDKLQGIKINVNGSLANMGTGMKLTVYSPA